LDIPNVQRKRLLPQVLAVCDFNQTSVIFQDPDIYRIVGDSAGNLIGISPFISKRHLRFQSQLNDHDIL